MRYEINWPLQFTFKYICTRRNDTHASTRPFKIQGNAFKGPINIFNKATLANVVAAVIFIPKNVDAPKVSKLMMIGVAAQK